MSSIDKILKLSNLKLPPTPQVEAIQWYRFVDSIGDPALRVVVVLADEAVEDQHWVREVQPIHDRIFDVLEAAGVEEFPYVRFITESDLAAEKAA